MKQQQAGEHETGAREASAAPFFGAMPSLEAVWTQLKGVQAAPVPMQRWAMLQAEYLREAAEIWNKTILHAGQGLSLPDRRFSDEAWTQNPAAAYMAAMYLLNARTMMQLAESVQADHKTKARIRFAVQQWIDATAPSNFFALTRRRSARPSKAGARASRRACSTCWRTSGAGISRRRTSRCSRWGATSPRPKAA